VHPVLKNVEFVNYFDGMLKFQFLQQVREIELLLEILNHLLFNSFVRISDFRGPPPLDLFYVTTFFAFDFG